jgi:energy-coupling factor transport system ATP-binding protein
MIEVDRIHYTYPDSDSPFSLRGISFCLRPGEKIAVMGPNGSGKTTLIRCLNGLIQPTSGKVSVDGMNTRNPEATYEVRRRVGMVFQNPDNQIVTTTVERELAFGLENLGLDRQSMRSRIEEAMERFHLVKYRQWPPHRLSGGERQRLALASIWVMAPKYLILDEPTSLLDPGGRKEVLEMLQRESEDGIGILLVTQYPEETLVFDRLLLIDSGEIVQDGDPETLFRAESMLSQLDLEPSISLQLKFHYERLLKNR